MEPEIAQILVSKLMAFILYIIMPIWGVWLIKKLLI